MDFRNTSKKAREILIAETNDYRLQYCGADYIENLSKEFEVLGRLLDKFYKGETIADSGCGIGLFKHANPHLNITNWDNLKRDNIYDQLQVTEVDAWYSDYTAEPENFYIYQSPIIKSDVVIVSRALERSMYGSVDGFKNVMKNLAGICNNEIVINQQNEPNREKDVKSFLQLHSHMLLNESERALVCSFTVDTINRW